MEALDGYNTVFHIRSINTTTAAPHVIGWLTPVLGALIGADAYQWIPEPEKRLQETPEQCE
jgi:hypothetical protein